MARIEATQIARAAYEAYARHVDGAEPWDGLEAPRQDAWKAAARAVLVLAQVVVQEPPAAAPAPAAVVQTSALQDQAH